jgi:hypothetical protein
MMLLGLLHGDTLLHAPERRIGTLDARYPGIRDAI